jgi:glyoxylase-like metal-dependent hydrolase (beta-lactamase superfamily II)
MQRARVGNVEIVSLNDAAFYLAPEHVYPDAGDVLDAYQHYLNDEGQLVLPVLAFLLRDGGQTVLVDTGLGPEDEGTLMRELTEAGVAPDEVDQVLFTHLHSDHTGWNIDRESGRLTFANARYLAPRGDWEHYEARSTPDAAFVRDMHPLRDLDRLELIEGERTLTSALVTISTPGHTPGHTSLAINSAGERGIILGDVLLTKVDAERPELECSFDTDRPLAVRTRHAMLDRMEAEGSLIGAAHLPAPGFGRIARVDGVRGWRAIGGE